MTTADTNLNATDLSPAKRRRWPWITALLAVFFLGVAIGGGTGQATPETKTVTEHVEVPTLPESCSRALTAAGGHISGLEKLLHIKIEWINKLSSQDYSGVADLIARQKAQITQNDTTVMQYAAAKLACDEER